MDLALFEAAYPGKDWRRMTYASFLAYVEYADLVHAILRGDLSDDQRRRLDLDRANRQILAQERFPLYFPPLDFEED